MIGSHDGSQARLEKVKQIENPVTPRSDPGQADIGPSAPTALMCHAGGLPVGTWVQRLQCGEEQVQHRNTKQDCAKLMLCYTEEATEAWYPHERHNPWPAQQQQLTNHGLPLPTAHERTVMKPAHLPSDKCCCKCKCK